MTRIAIIGAGAVTEKKHLPALEQSQKLHVTALVDLDEARVRRVGEAFGIEHRLTGTSDLANYADIAVVAVPHHLHAPVAIDAMRAGLHAFVEKPLATTMTDARRMLDVAAERQRRIGVGLVRRQYASFKFVKRVLERGWLGRVTSFDFREGGIYNWPVATATTFRKQTAGGVLFDTGAHTLDMLLSWLGGFQDVSYFDDSDGGVDANCELRLTLCSGVRGVIELSRTRALRNTCIITGERGELEVGVGPAGPVVLRADGFDLSGTPRVAGTEIPAPLDLTRIQLEEFADAVTGATECDLFAEHTLEPIRLYDACHASPKRLELPWEAWGSAPLPELTGRTVLVLGGTGFIGGRLVEVLARETGARVRVLARSLSKLAGVSRFDIEALEGDVTDPAALARAMAGADVVINTTFGRGSLDDARRVNVEAVKHIVDQAARAGISRVVHVSTVSVYGVPPDGDLVESASHRAPRAHVYGRTKLEGEDAGFAAARHAGVELIVLQPTVVYGPGAPSWTQNPLRMLKSGRVVLINGGDGLCNAVYVDDVVQALLRAAVAAKGAGERFLVSGPAPVTWREFYGAYEDMLGFRSTVSLTLEELDGLRALNDRKQRTTAQLASILRDPAVFRKLAHLPIVERVKSQVPRPVVEAGKSVLLGGGKPRERRGPRPTPEKPVHIPAALDAKFQAAKVHARIDKARQLLGYEPAWPFREGIARTRDWVAWANLLS